MGNQSCGVATAASKDRLPLAKPSTVSAAAPKKKAAQPAPTEASTTASLAEDAKVLRVFTERISSNFPDLSAFSMYMCATGGALVDAVAFEKGMRKHLKYADSAEIERIFKLLDVSKRGSISEFELAQLFTGPELLRGLERQLKGKMSTNFVAFNRFRPSGQGDITPEQFQEVLQELLGYIDVTLIETLFSIIDVAGTGSITQEEFKNFWNRGYPSPQGFYPPSSQRDGQPSTRRSGGMSPKRGDGAAKRVDGKSGGLRRSSTMGGGDSPKKECSSPKTPGGGSRRRSCPSVHMGQH